MSQGRWHCPLKDHSMREKFHQLTSDSLNFPPAVIFVMFFFTIMPYCIHSRHITSWRYLTYTQTRHYTLSILLPTLINLNRSIGTKQLKLSRILHTNSDNANKTLLACNVLLNNNLKTTAFLSIQGRISYQTSAKCNIPSSLHWCST